MSRSSQPSEIPSTALTRLGQGIYWASCMLAPIVLFIGLLAAWGSPSDQYGVAALVFGG